MTKEFNGEGSHFSIAMPDGTTCRAYVPFQVYSTDEGGEIVRLDFADFVRLGVIVASNRKTMRQVLTDLPHSPARTEPPNKLPHLDLSSLRIH
jgi:hypothetical protein